MKKMSLLFSMIFLFAFFSTDQTTEAAAKYSKTLLAESTKAYAITSTQTLLVDHVNNQLQVINLSTQQIVWSKKFPVVYDSQVLVNPLKIIVITSENNKLKKMTISADGTILSEQLFPSIKLTESMKISWAPAINKEKEKLAVVNGSQVLLYEYPWKKPITTFPYSLAEDKKYENTIIKDVQLQTPYVVIKLNGDNSTQSQDLYRILNITTKKAITIPAEWNVNTSFSVEGNELIVNSSSQIGHPLGINVDSDYIIYAKYDLKTGEINHKVSRSFSTQDSNWKSEYFNRKLVLTESEDNKLFLINQYGETFKEFPRTFGNFNYKTIGYDGNRIYLLVPSEDNGAELVSIL
ncbi:hypothetical protein QNH46_02555 [Paenibacillus woosongensis]|uniref:Copper amine oxidase-like N-terminal domain-containing protein n=1 Tax=Paenibacillus woosongensis TaxID=307580 RepID=A0AA95I8L1_9BACL|nr:hypothetical protein [Paenibacillus woosongensis]WHX49588.1 hypothetical protein QNH46_02555 [Paenibacillus woosongensis]